MHYTQYKFYSMDHGVESDLEQFRALAFFRLFSERASLSVAEKKRSAFEGLPALEKGIIQCDSYYEPALRAAESVLVATKCYDFVMFMYNTRKRNTERNLFVH